MLVIHHNDADGRCAAAIVRCWAKQNPSGVSPLRFFETDYKTPPPLDLIRPDETVIIVDFSYKPEEMLKLTAKTKNICWCDHHVTAKDYGYDLPGLRDFSDKGLAGCECAWRHFFPGRNLPLGVRLLGDYDSWRFELGEARAKAFYEGLKLEYQDPDSPLWEALFLDNDLPEKITENGHTAERYRDNYCLEIIKGYGYETELTSFAPLPGVSAGPPGPAGPLGASGPRGPTGSTGATAGGPIALHHKAFAMNAYKFGSPGFGKLFKEYDVCIAYIHDGKKFTVSLYSETVDVSAIAREFGGGGHRGAAGFVCEQLPFKPKEAGK